MPTTGPGGGTQTVGGARITPARARTRALAKTAPANLTEPVYRLDEETVRACIKAQVCPWCGRGPFKVLARHVSVAHATSPDELRVLGGFGYSDSICDPSFAAELSSIHKAMDKSHLRGVTPAKTKRLSPAGKRRQQANARRLVMTTDQRRQAGQAGGRTRGQQLQKERVCVVCDATWRNTAGRYRKAKTCSDECESLLRARLVQEDRARKRAERTHCVNGHPLAGENLRLFRDARSGVERKQCRTCQREADRRSKRRKRGRDA